MWFHTPLVTPTSDESVSAHDVAVTSLSLQKPIAFVTWLPQQPFPDPPGHIKSTPQPHSPSIAIVWPETPSSGLIHAVNVKKSSGFNPEYPVAADAPSQFQTCVASFDPHRVVTFVSAPLKYMEVGPALLYVVSVADDAAASVLCSVVFHNT